MELENKITDAMHRIEDVFNETEGKCYVSFSGGKDSTVILALIKMCEELYTIPKNGIVAVFCDTGIELGATRDFVRWCKENWYPNIEIIRPEKSFSWILENKGKPIKSKMRSQMIGYLQRGSDNAFLYLVNGVNNNGKKYNKFVLADKDIHFASEKFSINASSKCCDYLKKKPFVEYHKRGIKASIQGVRMSEGGARDINAKKRESQGGKICTSSKDGIIIKMPIIDWSNDDVDQFIEKYNVPLSKAYTEYGLKRTGCMGCPFAVSIASNLEVLWKYEPNRYKASMHWLKDVYIAQNVILPFDENYEKERKQKWEDEYFDMRNEMLMKYRPNSRLCKKNLDFKQLEMNFDRKEEK